LIISGAPLEGWGAPRKVLQLGLFSCRCADVSPAEEEVS